MSGPTSTALDKARALAQKMSRGAEVHVWRGDDGAHVAVAIVGGYWGFESISQDHTFEAEGATEDAACEALCRELETAIANDPMGAARKGNKEGGLA